MKAFESLWPSKVLKEEDIALNVLCNNYFPIYENIFPEGTGWYFLC